MTQFCYHSEPPPVADISINSINADLFQTNFYFLHDHALTFFKDFYFLKVPDLSRRLGFLVSLAMSADETFPLLQNLIITAFIQRN